MKTLKSWAAAGAVMAVTGAAQAALISRAGGTMVYDTTRNITWLADMNYAATSGYALANAPGGLGSSNIFLDGSMGWDAAVAWADNLVYGGYSDWRLPTLNPYDTTCSDNFDPGFGFPNRQYYGTGCTGGELSGLFVTDLGNRPYESVLTQAGDTAEQIANLALFSNVQAYSYWSGTVYAPDPLRAWVFEAEIFGNQTFNVYRFASLYAVAVRPGDVATPVPEPQTLALALLALGATVVARRRGRARHRCLA